MGSGVGAYSMGSGVSAYSMGSGESAYSMGSGELCEILNLSKHNNYGAIANDIQVIYTRVCK